MATVRTHRSPGRETLYMVPVAELRDACIEAVESGRFRWGELARACGFMYCDRYRTGDTSRLQRVLGLRRRGGDSDRGRMTNKTMSYENALRIVQALGADPVDFGV